MWRPAAIVDEDVGVGTGGECRGAAALGRDVAANRRHLGAGLAADLGGGLFERLAGARGDRQLDPGSPERHGAGPTEPLARGTDERLAAANPQIEHVVLPF